MVLPKRLDYGFNGYQVPAMPRGSRSSRGRRSGRKKVEENQMCAFELLATVAGKMLLEKESSPSSSYKTSGEDKPPTKKDTVKQEEPDNEEPFKVQPCDQGSCDEGMLASEIGFKRQAEKCTLNECPQASSAVAMGPAFIGIKPDSCEKIPDAKESIINGGKGEFGKLLGRMHGKYSGEKCSSVSAESHQGNKAEGGISTPLQVGRKRKGSWIDQRVAETCSLEDPMEVDAKPHTRVSSDSSVELPLRGDHIFRSSSFPKCLDDIELVVVKDDDENSSGCTQPCIITSKAFRPQRIGDRRISNLLACKFWKVGPTILKDGEFSNSDAEMKRAFCARNMCYTRQKTQRRKLFGRSSILTSDVGISSEGISNPLEKGVMEEGSDSEAAAVGENRASSTVTGQKSSFESEDYHVKLSIKSFEVPELFIEMPETATVGSLKRTVMEAVTAILGGGLRVGVLLQGKKVRDDNKTLVQAGISHSEKLDSLGFTIEPNPSQGPSQLTSSEDPHSLLLCDATNPLNRFPAVLTSDPGNADGFPDLPLTTSQNYTESDHDVPSPTDTSTLDKTIPNSKALVAIPALSVETLAVVPRHRKSRQSELVQRRIRRPFSVGEVEGLVQAVEKLGTGRWRDVKLRAFDNAKHRTYVDLKDKWKTLVHTAKISPQQRRGAPVPQELLDRVLSAHAYWSQQQAKLQVKQQQQAEACVCASPLIQLSWKEGKEADN